MRIFTDRQRRNTTPLRELERGRTFQHETHQYMKIDLHCQGITRTAILYPDHVSCVNIKHGSCRTLSNDTLVLKTDAECRITIEE